MASTTVVLFVFEFESYIVSYLHYKYKQCHKEQRNQNIWLNETYHVYCVINIMRS